MFCAVLLLLSGCFGASEDGGRGKPLSIQSEVETKTDVLAAALEDLQHPEGKNRMLKRKAVEELQHEEMVAAAAQRDDATGLPRASAMYANIYTDIVNPNKEILEFRNRETLNQVVDNLNQWLATVEPPAGWKPDPLISTLPEALARDGVVYTQLSQLAKLHFEREKNVIALDDGWFLQEAVWLRDVSRRVVRGEAKGQLAVAARLFDWTVRNLDLLPGEPEETVQQNGRPFAKHLPLQPWQALLFGKAQRVTRAWVFVLLARQQGIDAVLLEAPRKEGGGERLLWACAALVDGELHLFEPELGIPVPSKDGKKIATLKEVLASPEMLKEKLSSPKIPYRFADLDFANTVAAVEGSAQGLALRTALLQKELTGRNRFEAAAFPSAVAARLQGAGAARTVLWSHPFRLLRQVSVQLSKETIDAVNQELSTFLVPTAELWTARVFQLKGLFTVEQAEAAGEEPALVQPLNQKAAIQYFFDLRVMFAQAYKRLKEGALSPQQQGQIRQTIPFLHRAKQDADYWLALLNLDRGKTDVAIRGLKFDVLRDDPPSPWKDAARFNLGRIYEEQGDVAAALEAFDALTSGPHAPAAAWRAARLRENAPAAALVAPTP